MEKYDVIIVGAASSGAYFAQKMAEKGYSVKIIEKDSEEKVGTKYDIFHIAANDFKRFQIPRPVQGDKEWAFEFEKGYAASPTGNYPKRTTNLVVGLHMHEYTLLLNKCAKEAGVEIEYSAEFTDFIYKRDKIKGVKYISNGCEKEAYAKTVVDASGINAVCRTKLKSSRFINNLPLESDDMFYVILRYIKFKDKNQTLTSSTSWPFYKSWLAPQEDKNGGILGIGACTGYEKGEENFKKVENNIKLPAYDIVRLEKGKTPYTKPPYSFVDDNFIVTGDAACLTKPNNGEGVTSSMVQIEIATRVLDEALRDNDTSKEALWEINRSYNQVQGASFAFMRAILTKAVNATEKEFEYFFKHDIIFSEKFLSATSECGDLPITLKDIFEVGTNGIGGIMENKISLKTIKYVAEGAALAIKLKEHYLNFPETLFGFDDWKNEAEKLWSQVGKMK